MNEITKKQGRVAGWAKGVVEQQTAPTKRIWAMNVEEVASLRRTVSHSMDLLRDAKHHRQVEEFSAWQRRKGLSNAFIQQQGERFRTTQFLMYPLGFLVMLYGLWLGLTVAWWMGLGVAVWGAGALVQAYIAGFRAWQLLNRRRVHIQDAIWMSETYLVL